MTTGQKAIATKICTALGEGGVTLSLSTSEIAKIAGVKKTPYLFSIISDLMRRGLIARFANPAAPQRGWFFYATQLLVDSINQNKEN